ncbi:inactive serine/threonine-protein kinase TEX14 isoform X1 [Alligator mississippiensis]|uniref:inactive serine/threonine-protein kinase TEX14 isoform X1 n=1 Tax=Alligator mississippiensis TaxID=8496 RepID=UPI0028776D22|nr:inactive serine/threonine-protein kinase TEX14 isoform X1 [Alligator mississippiensis]
MSHVLPLPVPCPVSLGTVRRDGPEAELHEAVRRGSRAAVKKLLKRGIHVDAVNSLGQTALFTAALFGLGKIVDVLLDYGSDPNHRCYDGSTPVHAAAFSGNQGVLSKLLDVGGDLRVHDKDGRTPQCWALSAGKETSAQMLEFMQRCASHMQAAIQNFPSDLLRKTDSSKVLICGPGRFGGLVQGIADSPLGKFLKGGANSSRNIYSFGFGKFHLTGNKQLGYLASLPIIGDREVFQADDEPTFSYHTGPYMLMTNLMWGGSRVTVKELNFKPHQNCSKLRLADLLIAEQEHSSKLRHPHLLQLMAVCLSSDLEKTRLVYERVSFGSLYSILHERRSEFPVLYMETIVFLLLQINDALRFLHARGFVHRSLTSYAVQIVSAGEAKLTNLEYTLESKEGGEHIDLTRVAVPAQLYRWCSPEVILQKAATVKSDIYSFCTVMQEALTETLPWSGQEDSFIKELIVSRQYLNTDVRLPKPYYDIVKTGLEAKQKDRSISLQDIRYTLQNDLKDLIAARMDRPGESSHAQGHSLSADVNIYLGSESKYQRSTLELQGEAIVESACSYTVPRCSVSPAKKGTVLDHEAMVSVQPGLHDLSQDVASNLQRTFSASDVNESLCSFEMNEIYAYYSEFHENAMEGQAEIECALGAEIEKQNVEEGKDASKLLPVTSEIQLEEKPSSEEGSSSETDPEHSLGEEEALSETSELYMLDQEERDVRTSLSSPSRTGQHISKCVLNLKISQTFLQQATNSICRTEEKLNELETIQKQQRQLKEMQTEQFAKQMFIESYLENIDDVLKNVKIPYSGANVFLWKAVGPPSRNYTPPPSQVPGSQKAVGINHFQAITKAVQEKRKAQREKTECFGQSNKNKGDVYHSSFCLGSLVGPSNQQLHPRVSVRRKRNVNLQHESGGDTSSAGSAVEEEIWRLPKSASEISNRRILSEERRMVQPEWTTEVKQMAKRAVSGQLGLLPPYAPSECTSESEAESLKETYLQATIKDRGYPEWQRRAGRWQTGSGTETLDLGRKEKSESEWSDAESIFESFAGRNGQSPSKDEQAESGTASHKNSDISRGSQNLSRGHSRVLDHSSDSSPDLSDEFFTPDPDEFFPPVTQDSSEVETSSSEGELEITPKACVPNQIGADAESGRKKFLCNTAKENLSNNTVGVNQLSHMPVASVEAAQEMIPGEALEEFKENYISLTDIQDLSSISYERENSSKDSTCKTPRVGHAPTSVSTPLSPEKKVSSSAKKYRNTHEIPLDTSCWSTQETALTASSTFTTACEKQRSAELPFVPLESSSLGLTEPSGLSGLGAASSLIKARKEFGKPISTTEQIDLEKADLIPAFSQASDHFMDELPPPAQELLDEIEYLKQQTAASQEKGSCSSRVPVKAPSQCQLADKEEAEEIENQGEVDHTVWTKETLNQTEETERAHSTLDDALERLLHPIAEADKVQGGPEGLPLRATSLKDQGEEGMKSGIEESSTRAESRETESRAGNTEATYLEDQKPKLRQRLPWTSPVRVIVLDQSSPPK